MSTYRVGIPKVIWYSVKVEADDRYEAIDKAWDHLNEHHGTDACCAHCSGWGKSWSIEESDWGTCADMSDPPTSPTPYADEIPVDGGGAA